MVFSYRHCVDACSDTIYSQGKTIATQSLAERHAGAVPAVADSYERRAALLERVRLRHVAAETARGCSGSGAVSPCESEPLAAVCTL